MMKIIRFFSEPEYQGTGQPQPAKKFLPDWYRKSEMTFLDEDGKESPGLKRCIPFLDSMLSGYMLVTPIDIFVSRNEDGTLRIGWNSSEPLSNFIAERPKATGEKMPRPAGHYPNHLAFRGIWGMKTPRGWSLLITHPLNRHDLPWTITSGIMDSDKYSTSGNIPFFIREDFSGMIPAGTPFAQLIPIKRDSWSSIRNDRGLLYLERLQSDIVQNIEKAYKKFFWQKKEYN
jgi:hypothetical protein